MVTSTSSLPLGLDAALDRNFHERGFILEWIEPVPIRQPAEALAEAFGVPAEVNELACATQLADHLAIVLAEKMDATALNTWKLFLSRFLKVRAKQDAGLAILLIVSADTLTSAGLPTVAWKGRLRRIDVTIWADLHAPLNRPEPLATLAAALAVDLCGWRLDLAAEIAQARREDLLDPFGWLQLRVGQALAPCRLNGQDMGCPLALYEQGTNDEIRQRIWKAQLVALFPWLEEHRQRVIDRHRKVLRVSEHSQNLGVQDVDDLEFGALARQLRRRLARTEAELIDCFAELRNDLAHRRGVKPDVLDRALRESQKFERYS